ncbi:hypothetical protein D1871_18405 [Nakamurella silvestris]|nr:hypothetical protein D1871_18405 [Nakamurella silvestris]
MVDTIRRCHGYVAFTTFRQVVAALPPVVGQPGLAGVAAAGAAADRDTPCRADCGNTPPDTEAAATAAVSASVKIRRRVRPCR